MTALAAKEPTVSSIPEASVKGKLIADVMLLALQAQYHTNLCVFAEFIGHVDTLNLSVRKSQDEYDQKLMTCSIRLVPYPICNDLQKELFETKIIMALESVKDQLTKFAETGELGIEAFRDIDLCITV